MPDSHFLMTAERHNRKWRRAHAFDCTATMSVARQAIEALRPGMEPDEISVARRVIREALDRLEKAEREGKPWQPEVIDRRQSA
jgi:hypothetical protein